MNKKISLVFLLSVSFLFGCGHTNNVETQNSNVISSEEKESSNSSIVESEISEIEQSDLSISELESSETTTLYTVTFHITDQDEKIVEVKENEKVELFTPERNGFTFLGWYNSDEILFDENTLITANLELFAKWELQFGELV